MPLLFSFQPAKTEEEKPPEEPEEEKSEEPVKETVDTSENKETEGKENGEIGEEEEAAEEEDDDEDDSDEDNVHVIIGDINRSSPSYTNLNISKRGPTIPAPGVKVMEASLFQYDFPRTLYRFLKLGMRIIYKE